MIADVKEIELFTRMPQKLRIRAEAVEQAIGVARQARSAKERHSRESPAKRGAAAPCRQPCPARRLETRQQHFGAQVHARPLFFRKIGEHGQANAADGWIAVDHNS
jgi:hypothetical protein